MLFYRRLASYGILFYFARNRISAVTSRTPNHCRRLRIHENFFWLIPRFPSNLSSMMSCRRLYLFRNMWPKYAAFLRFTIKTSRDKALRRWWHGLSIEFLAFCDTSTSWMLQVLSLWRYFQRPAFYLVEQYRQHIAQCYTPPYLKDRGRIRDLLFSWILLL